MESNIENHRVRKVILYYYLEDDSMHVAEPRQDNSGIPQVTSHHNRGISVASGSASCSEQSRGLQVAGYCAGVAPPPAPYP